MLRMHGSALAAQLRQRITFPDGRADVWALFYDPVLFDRVIDAPAEPLRQDVSKIAGIEARGFVLGAAVAARLGAGFVAIRKQGGLYPGPKLTAEAGVDYRGQQNVLRLQRAACGPGRRARRRLVSDRQPGARREVAYRAVRGSLRRRQHRRRPTRRREPAGTGAVPRADQRRRTGLSSTAAAGVAAAARKLGLRLRGKRRKHTAPIAKLLTGHLGAAGSWSSLAVSPP